MEYAISYFGKRLQDLEFADVERFFEVERTESDQLEFKSFQVVSYVKCLTYMA